MDKYIAIIAGEGFGDNNVWRIGEYDTEEAALQALKVDASQPQWLQVYWGEIRRPDGSVRPVSSRELGWIG